MNTLSKNEAFINGRKYLHKDSILYNIRDRESDDDYDVDETWRFKNWRGSRVADATVLGAFDELINPGDCMVCFDKFNKAARIKITCPYCHKSVCRMCAKMYLKSDDFASPKCPDCRTGWSEEFLGEVLDKTFMLTDYKHCREKVLLDTEKARLPETQTDAVRYMEARRTIEPLRKKVDELKKQIEMQPESKIYEQKSNEYKNFNASGKFSSKIYEEHNEALCNVRNSIAIRKLNKEIMNIQRDRNYNDSLNGIENYGRMIDGIRGEARNEKENHWTFVMRCLKSECMGFVGLNWKCGLCAMKVCKSCHEQECSEHKCKSEDVANVEAIRKEAKPCPKCATMISKIDGCDQMWCTQCKTAFSWRTGAIETHVHNPHYFEWLRRNGGEEELNRPRQINGCIPIDDMIDQIIWSNRVKNHEVMWFCRFVSHIHNVEIKQGALDFDEKKRILRVRRLAAEIDDTEWMDRLQRLEKAGNKSRRVNQVLEMFVQSALDILQQSMHTENIDNKQNILRIMDQAEDLRKYCKEQLEKIKVRYNNKVPDLEIKYAV
jgi:hypothetical protein